MGVNKLVFIIMLTLKCKHHIADSTRAEIEEGQEKEKRVNWGKRRGGEGEGRGNLEEVIGREMV